MNDVRDDLKNYDMIYYEIDKDFTVDEFIEDISKFGRGIGMDGFGEKIAHLFWQQLRLAILQY